MRRARRRDREEELSQPEETQVDPEEIELAEFLDGVGGQGIAEVHLYRLLESGKQKFVDSGPPSKFSEKMVQTTYGGGVYVCSAGREEVIEGRRGWLRCDG